MTDSNFIPDPKKHLYISIAKSALRIVGFVSISAVAVTPLALIGTLFILIGVVLTLAEVLGIIEELV